MFEYDADPKSLMFADTSELFIDLYQGDSDIALRALDRITYFIRKGNADAFKNLIRYNHELGPATTLEDVHYRVELMDCLASLPKHPLIVDALVQELTRTPSNNTTRQLYTKILKRLSQYPQEDIEGPLTRLLEQVTFSSKIKRRIMEVAGLIEPEEDTHDFLIWF